MKLHFVPAELTFVYLAAARAYLERHGKPAAFYIDKASVFRPTRDSSSAVGISTSSGSKNATGLVPSPRAPIGTSRIISVVSSRQRPRRLVVVAPPSSQYRNRAHVPASTKCAVASLGSPLAPLAFSRYGSSKREVMVPKDHPFRQGAPSPHIDTSMSRQ